MDYRHCQHFFLHGMDIPPEIFKYSGKVVCKGHIAVLIVIACELSAHSLQGFLRHNRLTRIGEQLRHNKTLLCVYITEQRCETVHADKPELTFFKRGKYFRFSCLAELLGNDKHAFSAFCRVLLYLFFYKQCLLYWL